jgi:GAF domain-containing protein
VSERPIGLARTNRRGAGSRSSAGTIQATPEVLRRIARRLAAATGDACTVRLLSDDGLLLIPVAGHFHDPDVLAEMRETMLVTQRADDGLWKVALSRREPTLFVIDTSRAPADASPPQRAFIARWLPRFVLGAPLLVGDVIVGGIGLTRFVQTPFSSHEIELVQRLAQEAGDALGGTRAGSSPQAGTV